MAENNYDFDTNEIQEAEELLKREAEENAMYESDYQNLLKEMKTRAEKLRAAQLKIQKLHAKKTKQKTDIPYEITDEKLADPAEIGNVDELKDMIEYYKECFNGADATSKSKSVKRGERRYNAKMAKQYKLAYEFTSEITAKVESFMEKYKEKFEAENVIVEEDREEVPPFLEDEKPGAEKPDAEKPKKKAPKKPETEKPGAEKPKKKAPKKPETEKPDAEKPGAEKPGAEKPGAEKPKEDKKPGLLKNIDAKYYGQIFKLINNVVVIGSKYKYNTLDNLEYEVTNADPEKMHELGFPVDDPEKANEIKKACLKLIKVSKEIRKDQWLTQNNENKKGTFEARKHSTQEAIVDRNNRLVKKLRISKDIAQQYGLSLSVEDLEKDQETKKETTKAQITTAKEDPIFTKFYEEFKSIYKLGAPTGKQNKETDKVLYQVYQDLAKNKENNSFGLKGESLKAALSLVEQTIFERRNTWQKGKKSSQSSIEQTQKDLGL